MKIHMSVECGSWKVKFNGLEVWCSDLNKLFPLELLEFVKKLRAGEDASLDFNGESQGWELFVRPERDGQCRLIIASYEDYDGGFSLPVDGERAGLRILPTEVPGNFSVHYEDGRDMEILPNGRFLLDCKLSSQELALGLLVAIREVRAGKLLSTLFEDWFCREEGGMIEWECLQMNNFQQLLNELEG